MGWGSAERTWLAVLERTASCPYACPVPCVLFTSGGVIGVKPGGQTKPPASGEQAAVERQGQLFNERGGFFFPSFSLFPMCGISMMEMSF